MGEAKRRQLRAEQLTALEDAVSRVASAVRRLASAASSRLGSDCYLHAELGRRLLEDEGFVCQRVTGFAAWRVGPGDGDVVSHTPKAALQHLPPGEIGFAYHAWLTCQDYLIDLTTYQLRKKAADLDAADGGRTLVEWCPDHLLVPKRASHDYREVAQSLRSGVFYYEPRPGLDVTLGSQFELAPSDLSMARILVMQPDVRVMGPNDWRPS